MRIVKKFEDRKAEIIKVARNFFQTKDYNAITMQELIDTLGIAKGTLYHYFKSKEELLEAVIEDIIQDSLEQLNAAIHMSQLGALDRLKLLINASNRATDNPNILNQLHKPGNEALHTRLLAAIVIKQAPLYAAVIKDGCKEGIFKTEVPLECAEFILSGIQFLTDQGIYPWAREDLQRRAQAIPRLVEQLLNAPQGSFQFLIDALSES